MWVKLRTVQNIMVHGVLTTYRPGDWVNVGRHIAEQWIAGGSAVAIDPDVLTDAVTPTTGIVVRGGLSTEQRSKIEQIAGVQVAFADQEWTPCLPFTETLIWHTSVDLRFDLLLTGFALLKKGWQVVVPLYDYTTLAAHVGTAEDRDQTERVIRDLRVPLRDTRLVYARRCEDTRALMEAWGEALGTGCDERLAFLQALYTVKPVVCDVPASWAGKNAR